MIEIRKAAERGRNRISWLDSYMEIITYVLESALELVSPRSWDRSGERSVATGRRWRSAQGRVEDRNLRRARG